MMLSVADNPSSLNSEIMERGETVLFFLVPYLTPFDVKEAIRQDIPIKMQSLLYLIWLFLFTLPVSLFYYQ